MIDKKIFAVSMAMLADRFNRAFTGETQREYLRLCSAELTTEEFQAAAQIAFRDCTFWPSPKELIDFVKPKKDFELEGARAFSQLQKLGEAAPGYGAAWKRETVLGVLGDAALDAFDAIGGNNRMRALREDDIAWARREFVAAFKTSSFNLEHKNRLENALGAGRAPLALAAGGAQ